MIKKVLLLSLMIPIFGFSQNKDTIYTITSNGIVKTFNEEPKWYNHTPGDELQLYTLHYYSGLAVVPIGTAMVFSNMNSPRINSIQITGGILVLIGVILNIESHIHIHRAGILLEKDRVGIKFNF
jgi:hypothetical protein